MPIRVCILWHMHQPFYKDLVTGQYRLPWVRLHALKDYFGMVKLLGEFPSVRQTFNLVPSLITQIEDYAAGTARDPFFDVAAKPARHLTPEDRRFALEYLFQANATHMIGRYPRYAELHEQVQAAGDAARAESNLSEQDFTDLQVLSQLAWFDEFFLEERGIAELVAKGRDFSEDDQRMVIGCERELITRVLPAYREAAQRGAIEISTSPFYHPILPLLCDTNIAAVSSPGLPLPQAQFRHAEDARAQLQRGLELYRATFGQSARGVWPSEGSVSEEVLDIAASLGVQWMASDEGVLARTLNTSFARDGRGVLEQRAAEQLYNIYRYENGGAVMHLLFRDHAISDLIGFVYSGMEARVAATHLLTRIKESAQPLAERGLQPVVPIILDGENAWESFPHSGREFLRRFYDALQKDTAFEALTISEAISRQHNFPWLGSLTPGSWINSNFNVWIGAPEDNRSWDYLNDAREFYAEHGRKTPPEQNRPERGTRPTLSPKAGEKGGASTVDLDEEQRGLAYEELLIAEGSDWNWWYGPEHHSANDRDFDELYRKHLSNVYALLGAAPPEYLAQPIAGVAARPYFVPQTGYIHPQLDASGSRYFDWVGAAMYTAERSQGAMHGGRAYLEAMHAGIDEHNLYIRVDFCGGRPPDEAGSEYMAVIAVESAPPGGLDARSSAFIQAVFAQGDISRNELVLSRNGTKSPAADVERERLQVHLRRSLTASMPLEFVQAETGGKLKLRISLWRDRLPVDALPLEGSIELDLLSEADLAATAF